MRQARAFFWPAHDATRFCCSLRAFNRAQRGAAGGVEPRDLGRCDNEKAVEEAHSPGGWTRCFGRDRPGRLVGGRLKRPAVAGEAPLAGDQSPVRRDRDHSRWKILSSSVSTRLA